jgi:hypothetical protein
MRRWVYLCLDHQTDAPEGSAYCELENYPPGFLPFDSEKAPDEMPSRCEHPTCTNVPDIAVLCEGNENEWRLS